MCVPLRKGVQGAPVIWCCAVCVSLILRLSPYPSLPFCPLRKSKRLESARSEADKLALCRRKTWNSKLSATGWVSGHGRWDKAGCAECLLGVPACGRDGEGTG